VKEGKIDTAQKAHAFNKSVHAAAREGVSLMKDHLVINNKYGVMGNFVGMCYLLGADAVLKRYDCSKVIRDEMQKKVSELLQFIDVSILESKHPEVEEFLKSLKQDVIERQYLFENIQEISDISDMLHFIQDIKNDADAASQIQEDIAEDEMASDKTWYEYLEISKEASLEEIKKAYRTLAKKYHPDLNPDPMAGEMFRKISEAYQILSCSQKRKEYDKTLA
jgi:predicted RND superfamily exporter protein